MKKLYTKGKKIHPSPPPPTTDYLSLLPAVIITLAAALSPEDKEVLAYLISCSGTPTPTPTTKFSGSTKTTTKTGGTCGSSDGDHPPQFHCNCFRCYMSYWIRWDNSPNRQLIHEIIDAYEDGPLMNRNYKKDVKNKKERRKKMDYLQVAAPESDHEKRFSSESDSVEPLSQLHDQGIMISDDAVGEEEEKGSVRKIVSFIGEKIWGVWGI